MRRIFGMEGEGARVAGRAQGAEAARTLDVSVVVPARDEETTLRALVESLQSQTLAPAEIVIVDGGSTDGTREVVRRLADEDARVRLVEAGEATPGRGRNVGTEAARNEWVAYVDAGIRVEPTWLERLARETERDPSVEVVFGNYEPITRTRFERWAALAYITPKVLRPGGPMRGPVVPSSLMRREVWRAVGGFPDLRAAEDMIFVERVLRSGRVVAWAPRATVWWHVQPTLRATFRRFVLYSRHNVWAGRQHDWHHGVARQYLLQLPFVALAFAHSAWWLVVPVVWTLARVVKTLRARREGRGLGWVLNPARVAGVGAILLTIDAATFLGWAQATVFRRWYR